MIVSYPLVMLGRSFSLGKYSEQGEGSQNSAILPQSKARAVLPFHSSCLLRTVTQPGRKAQERQEVPVPTRV